MFSRNGADTLNSSVAVAWSPRIRRIDANKGCKGPATGRRLQQGIGT